MPKGNEVESGFSLDSNLGFDETGYTRWDALRKFEAVNVNCFLSAAGIAKNDTMGWFVIRSSAFVPRDMASDGYYHKVIAYECELHAGVMNTKYSITSQAMQASVGFKVENLPSAIQIPDSDQLTVDVAENAVNTTLTGFEIGGNYGVSATVTDKGTVSVAEQGSISGKFTRSKTKTVVLRPSQPDLNII